MFIGREDETERLEQELTKPSAFVILYGKRRVGKSTLLGHVLSRSTDPTIFFECIKGTLGQNALDFADEAKSIGIDVEESDDFIKIFRSLNSMDKTFNVVLDEYPFLKKMERGDYVDSVFQNIVDKRLKNVRLFLSGSEVGMMKDLDNPGNALFGRCTLKLELSQLDYKEAAAFYPDKSVYDKIAFYSVFGGSPFVNEAIDPELSLRDNIKKLYLSKNGVAANYAKLLLYTDDPKARAETEPLLLELGNGRKKYGDLKRSLHIDNDNTFKKILDAAKYLELVSKIYPINKEDDAKKSSYEITDNALRFYYTYIYPNRNRVNTLSADEFYDQNIEPSVSYYISRRFEEICRTFFRQKIKNGEYKDAVSVGAFYYDDPIHRQNGEFDVAIKREEHRKLYYYDIYEVKFFEEPLQLKRLTEELDDVKKIKDLPVQNVGIIAANGFRDECTEFFKGPLIDGEELYR